LAASSKTFIAMCTTAIGLIYAAGYAATQPQDISLAMEAAQPNSDAAHSYAALATPLPDASLSAKPSPLNKPRSEPLREQHHEPAAKPENSASTISYKDGTFKGSGTNRFGTVEVAVTIAKGKINRVEITRSATRYPQRYIESLPAEVVANQSPEIDAASGATRSSEDFINAVRMALGQAE